MSGIEIIKSALNNMPSLPGVYRMIGAGGTVLYVGKARDLKKRVTSYTKPIGMINRILRMVNQVERVDYTTTRSEAEALLLEANLIKSLNPRYNILLKDDKSFPYIKIDGSHPYPRIYKYRGVKEKESDYFGPFASTGAVNQALVTLQKAFLLRPCKDAVFKGRTRPCLQYQINRCSAPCVDKISKEDYKKLTMLAKDFLSGKSREIQESLAAEMESLSAEMKYEDAARMRDRIKALTQIQQEQRISLPGLVNADIFALHRNGAVSAVEVFMFRSGQNFGNRSYFPSHDIEASDEEIITTVIGRFYQINPPPVEIICNVEISEKDLLEEAISSLSKNHVRTVIINPKRGEKLKAVEIALTTAKESLFRRLSESARDGKILEEIADIFGLIATPEIIEVYDNSHIMGTNQVGAMIAAGADGFIKDRYRKFNIKDTPKAGDDYGMMREVITRRFLRLKQEEEENGQVIWPDLVLVDGGLGQLNATLQALEALQIDHLKVAAIAKGPDRNAGKEEFFLPGKPPFRLPENSPTLYYLQRLRDESHRFAIGTHRKKRDSGLTRSELDHIPGVGSGRKKSLLQHFGSVKAIERASLEEIKNVEGLNSKTAEVIFNYFRG
jgi:excinuclease ABC subunit C